MFQLFICDQVLEEEGVHGHVAIDELELDLVPLDRDIMSLELPDFYRQFYLVTHPFLAQRGHNGITYVIDACTCICGVLLDFDVTRVSTFQHGDQTYAHTVAQSLLHIQQFFGLIPRVYGVGRCAKVSHTIPNMSCCYCTSMHVWMF